MNNEKTGILIKRLRQERGMTQKQVADRLHVSDRAVSKWERGCGSPDVSLLRGLAAVLDVDVQSILAGELNPNDTDGGNMKRMRFYRCPACGNVLTSTSEAEPSCCGRSLKPLEARAAEGEHGLAIEEVEDEYYVVMDHPMTKSHHIAFVACATDERIMLVRMYPEQGAQARFPRMPRGVWYACCTEHGLFELRGMKQGRYAGKGI